MNRFDFITKPRRIKTKRKYVIKKKPPISHTKTTGNAWVGRWQDGTLGWGVPNFIDPYSNNRLDQDQAPWFYGAQNSSEKIERAYLCKVTIEQIFDKNNKPITRKNIKRSSQ